LARKPPKNDLFYEARQTNFKNKTTDAFDAPGGMAIWEKPASISAQMGKGLDGSQQPMLAIH
jgi:hypothetical protein